MPRRHHAVGQILAKLREAEVAMSKEQSMAHVCRALRITEQAYNRWRNEYGGLEVDLIKRVKDLEWENIRLNRTIADPFTKECMTPGDVACASKPHTTWNC